MSHVLARGLPGYETIFITSPDLSDEVLKGLKDRLSPIVEQFGGKMVLTEDWGKRKLAYPIRKETRGHYSYFVYTGNPGVVHEVERNLRIQEHILRFLTVNLDQVFDSEQFQKRRADLQAAAKRREEERESRREERGGYMGEGRRRQYDYRSGESYERDAVRDAPVESQFTADEE